MNTAPADLIEAWFSEHCDDGEFVLAERTVPYALVAPRANQGRIIFGCKSSVVLSALQDLPGADAVGLRGGCGLPHDRDVAWIRAFSENHRLLFLGDMDPPDLLIFAWLRVRLAPTKIEYMGISDSYLEKLRIVVQKSFLIRWSASEESSADLLEKTLPDLQRIVGPRCAQLVEQRRKIEIEAVLSTLGSPVPLLRPVVEML